MSKVGQLERATQNRVVKINNGKIYKKDSAKFIDFLTKNTNARVIDSWDVWDERGYLKIASRINPVSTLKSGRRS